MGPSWISVETIPVMSSSFSQTKRLEMFLYSTLVASALILIVCVNDPGVVNEIPFNRSRSYLTVEQTHISDVLGS